MGYPDTSAKRLDGCDALGRRSARRVTATALSFELVEASVGLARSPKAMWGVEASNS